MEAGVNETMPGPVRPMFARPDVLPPDDGAWALEMKWDGVRALACLDGQRTRLVSRGGQDITATYPELAGLAGALPGRPALLDGEVVVLSPDGWPDFEALQRRIHVSAGVAARLAATTPVTYLSFDLLHLDGQDLLTAPYTRRRELLDSLDLNGGRWQTPPSFTGVPGADLLAVSRQHGLEGVVAKRLASRYEPGKRSGSWLKIKNVQHQEAVVGGWRPGKGLRTGQLGSLLVGIPGPGGLAYAGHVGTGFTHRTLDLLTGLLAPLRRAGSPFAEELPADHARDAIWAEPSLVVEVVFASWTRAGMMRAPTYRGLREDKRPDEVTRES